MKAEKAQLEEGNAPAQTEFTEDMTGYFDNWDFRPYVTAILLQSVDFWKENEKVQR